jgi:hypothetical protein
LFLWLLHRLILSVLRMIGNRICWVYCSVKNISPYWNIVILGQKLGKCYVIPLEIIKRNTSRGLLQGVAWLQMVVLFHSTKLQILATSVQSVFYICKQCRYTLPYIEAIPQKHFANTYKINIKNLSPCCQILVNIMFLLISLTLGQNHPFNKDLKVLSTMK